MSAHFWDSSDLFLLQISQQITSHAPATGGRNYFVCVYDMIELTIISLLTLFIVLNC